MRFALRIRGAKRCGYYSSYGYYEYSGNGSGKRGSRRSKDSASVS